MLSLEQYGIQPGGDESHKFDPSAPLMDESVFYEGALDLLEEMAPIVLDEAPDSLANMEGRWNPGAFMVFPLGVHPELGSLRLHLFPNSIPRGGDGPHVHDHAWYLASRVLTGEYRDDIVEVEVTDVDEQERADFLGIYETRRPTGLRNTFRNIGRVSASRLVESRLFSAGNSHTISPGVLHVPTVPEHMQGSTLVFVSAAIADSTRVIMPSSLAEQDRQRAKVTDRELKAARQILLG